MPQDFGQAVTVQDDDGFGPPVSVDGAEPFNMQTGEGAMAYSQKQAQQDIPQPKRIPTLQDYANAQPINELTGIPEKPMDAAKDAVTTSAIIGSAYPGIAAAEKGIIPALAATGRTLVGGTVGGSLGAEGGGRVGRMFGPTGEKIGQIVGGVGGGIIGASLGGGMERNPATGEIKSMPFGMQRFIPDWMVPKSQSDQAALQLREALAEGRAMRIPLRVRPPLELPTGAEGVTGAAPLRPLIGSPEDWQAYDQKMGILENEAKTSGMYHAARGAAGKAKNLQQRVGSAFGR